MTEVEKFLARIELQWLKWALEDAERTGHFGDPDSEAFSRGYLEGLSGISEPIDPHKKAPTIADIRKEILRRELMEEKDDTSRG